MKRMWDFALVSGPVLQTSCAVDCASSSLMQMYFLEVQISLYLIHQQKVKY